MRGIYTYHARTLGWCDVGYNVLVDKYGQAFEGRRGGLDRNVQGAHAGGFSPIAQETVFPERLTRRLNALLLTCGIYDSVGSFAYRVGLPAKSGVGGGIVAVIPGKATVAVWSPELDRFGTSVVGTAALEAFSQITNCSVL